MVSTSFEIIGFQASGAEEKKIKGSHTHSLKASPLLTGPRLTQGCWGSRGWEVVCERLLSNMYFYPVKPRTGCDTPASHCSSQPCRVSGSKEDQWKVQPQTQLPDTSSSAIFGSKDSAQLSHPVGCGGVVLTLRRPPKH